MELEEGDGLRVHRYVLGPDLVLQPLEIDTQFSGGLEPELAVLL